MDINQGIILDMLPMPPSENEAYATDWKTQRRFLSKEMTQFKERFQIWSLKPNRVLKIAKIIEQLRWELADHRKAIRVDAYLFFQYESLFTKAKGPTERPRRKRMNDPSNKGKALYDVLATMLQIDDSRLIPGEIVPVIRTEPTGQYAMVRLSMDMVKTDEEFFADQKLIQKI